MADLTDEEMERRMRAKLFPKDGGKVTGFSDEERRMAERLVGTANMRRIATAKGGRPVRPLPPPRISYEWYWFKGAYGEFWSWRINRVEDGQPLKALEGSSVDELEMQIEAIKAKGFRVVENNLDRGHGRPAPKQQLPSRRKAALEELRFFRR